MVGACEKRISKNQYDNIIIRMIINQNLGNI